MHTHAHARTTVKVDLFDSEFVIGTVLETLKKCLMGVSRGGACLPVDQRRFLLVG